MQQPARPTRVRFHAAGDWPRDRVSIDWAPDSRPHIPEIESGIELAWQRASSRPGVHLFDGPMCRLESFQAGDDLRLKISSTSYKVFVGTNLTHPQWADRFGWPALANPIGLSSALQSADGFLMLGCRNASVAYYPNRVHPFAGAMEPNDPMDVFQEIERELDEELGMKPSDITSASCIGVAEDVSLRQPELIFAIQSHLTRARIESALDADEHLGCMAIPTNTGDIEAALADPALTPIAVATLLLWGRGRWGDQWFDEARRPVTLEG